MNPKEVHVLAVNCGISSARFALFDMARGERRLLKAFFEGIGLGRGRASLVGEGGRVIHDGPSSIPDHEAAARQMHVWLAENAPGVRVSVVGHRIVHGIPGAGEPVPLDKLVKADLARMIEADPGQKDRYFRVVQVLEDLLPDAASIACFDCAFHRTMPPVARMHPLPRELMEQGVVRYGIHGLSCEHVMQQLASLAGESSATGRVVIAHLGCSASMTAVRGGSSVENTAGFVPSGGLMMGTRAGDLGPGVILHLLMAKGLSAVAVGEIVTQQSGLLGVSKVSRDMRELLKVSETNPQAAEAVALYCYTARKHLGSLVAVLGGLETLVFTAGIGENAARVRRGICEGLEFLGLRLDAALNRENAPVVSAAGSAVTVRVIGADEEIVIARASLRAFKLAARG
jgi:acetate kinase